MYQKETIENLMKAIRHGKLWLDKFNRVDYKASFERYKEVFAPAYLSVTNDLDTVQDLAKDIVDTIEAGWSKELFFNRGGAKVDDKMMLVVYLTPMLLSLNDEKCKNLAEEICSLWNKRFPKEAYQMADYDAIANGFTNAIMGISIGS